jgi:histidine triad (HIT) family protein
MCRDGWTPANPPQHSASVVEEGCAFCRIVAGSAESSRVYEDASLLAFMDLQPATTGHMLVVPKRHAATLAALDEDLGAAVFRLAQRLAAAVRRSGLPCEGVNLFLADGEAAFQEVFHTHLHVIPRTVGDGFRIDADWRSPSRGELDSVAAVVRAALGS